ncbi:UDP-3-O-(3-hydroxymyristoyl)glucosamine N-acyltransferase [Actimicrobium sp. CCI2.3]|uniref:UDP-3-O-(3-hydroxymyristoyl)glucosamine N-acyltransferase n=1 Tax=Actimicrobium sp. CCI2.3 TaxID=3048616 RepID=UPI002AB39202|nr:UDP-3-O-(3-hydroxymyristoyl)glucosamine N-acyltransferase [Actimicrobium sp. CCI2.3]MDY7572804.1 UDP-3-O-(3-hydroxymyristoyl)glucosamine N-acyltransferase [Actimicrobium sp. CCI2.3]MEB0020649.1 UDP-3-O-(3-hydroxymyristoyl)glucosamine N-acyltransferase [Actimicrobium sp. CCI2.3]
MPMYLVDLVARLGGQLIGDAGLRISGIAPLDDASNEHITFLTNPKLRASAATTQAAAMILSPAAHALLGSEFAGSRIVTDNPYAYFARVAQLFAALDATPFLAGIHASACVDPSAHVAASAHVGPHVVIEADAVIGEQVILEAGCFIGRGAHIGAGTHFHARVTFQARCQIGARGIIHSGAVIGADGFGFANEGGAWIKIPQTGRVLIAEDVEIGANTCIDRGALADTIIEEGVKLDNQIQIGHNCHIGAHTAMAGCVGVAGSAVIGKYCTFGGAAMVLGHLTIADKVHISSGSLVTRSISEAGQYTGFYPLAKNAEWEKTAVIVRNLGTMREKIRTLEKTVKSLTEKNNE